MILTPLQDIIYKKGALDFKDLAIAALEDHYKKSDVHDEFDGEKTKIYLKSLQSAILTIKNLNVSQVSTTVER